MVACTDLHVMDYLIVLRRSPLLVDILCVFTYKLQNLWTKLAKSGRPHRGISDQHQTMVANIRNLDVIVALDW